MTARFEAEARAREACVKLLLASGASVKLPSADVRTLPAPPAVWAGYYKWLGAWAALGRAGADLENDVNGRKENAWKTLLRHFPEGTHTAMQLRWRESKSI